ncbi:hypothetical protein ACHAW5_002731 [Stephanodiscus triporus]|uniref:Senescence domain-containing protein n=1 Tax=Stephanodiscus triporus TaxID=2934178 RepID=A0ABD3P412_9STRA
MASSSSTKNAPMTHTNDGGLVNEPLHYIIPNEEGYFPAGSDEAVALLAEIKNATLYQVHPRFGKTLDGPLASGTLTLRDPDAGTADDVVLVGQCGDALFYVMADDATKKTSDFEFVLMLPEDCIVIDLTECGIPDVLRVEALLAARTKFHDETTALGEASKKPTTSSKLIYPENLPTDSISRSMFWASSKVSQILVSAGELGASKIDSYSEKQKEGIMETKDVKVSQSSIKIAKATRKVSEKTFAVTEKVTGKISDYVGSSIGRACAIKKGDSAYKNKARTLLLASTLSYGEIGNGASECYEKVVKSAQAQATSFVAEKYGQSAAELCRHTAGAATNFGRSALTARRVVDPKKLIKSVAKHAVKESTKEAT